MPPNWKMKRKEFNKLYPIGLSEAEKYKLQKELKLNIDEASSEEIDWAIKKMRARNKRRLNGSTK